ncbi:hypothetical protein E2C01_092779 [Portunus trituberculatus]|uniref:Uncharacterized protein n=1 Tax=Portunus trituberculatus TaxID=210409 RepID=A0A5B7JMZ7_PORTR|nr:hypothetical protein [Portunus trituberculatus]
MAAASQQKLFEVLHSCYTLPAARVPWRHQGSPCALPALPCRPCPPLRVASGGGGPGPGEGRALVIILMDKSDGGNLRGGVGRQYAERPLARQPPPGPHHAARSFVCRARDARTPPPRPPPGHAPGRPPPALAHQL